jgi:hypothetical protein
MPIARISPKVIFCGRFNGTRERTSALWIASCYPIHQTASRGYNFGPNNIGPSLRLALQRINASGFPSVHPILDALDPASAAPLPPPSEPSRPRIPACHGAAARLSAGPRAKVAHQRMMRARGPTEAGIRSRLGAQIDVPWISADVSFDVPQAAGWGTCLQQLVKQQIRRACR